MIPLIKHHGYRTDVPGMTPFYRYGTDAGHARTVNIARNVDNSHGGDMAGHGWTTGGWLVGGVGRGAGTPPDMPGCCTSGYHRPGTPAGYTTDRPLPATYPTHSGRYMA